jgi:hypothetical protein
MKCWVKIAATVSLLALLGIDIGLQVERYFGTPPGPMMQVVIPPTDPSKWTDIAQAGSAIIVAIFTAMLLRTSGAQWQTMREQSQHAADQLAAFQAGERPYVFILDISEIGFELDEGDNPMQRLTYAIINHGKTPAIIDYIQIGDSVSVNQPAMPDREEAHHPLLASPIMASGEKREGIGHFFGYAIEWEEFYDRDGPSYEDQQYPDSFTPVLTGDENLYFRMIVGYHGVSSKGHSTSSCWRYRPETRQFIQYGGADLNFVR